VDVARIRSLRFADRERTRKEEVGRRSAGRLAYVAPPTIDRESLDRLHREAELLQADADGLILDLRENVGGDLPEEFLRQLDRRSLLQRQPRGQTRRGAPRPLWDRPIAVLIGPGTGSAAEIVAEGLRASGRATLIGEPTLGAVIGADEIALQMGLHFRIPRIGWYTLQGENLEGRGVLPAISVNSSPGRDADPVLERAIEVLGNEARPKN
jgi:tricorn protease